MKVTEDWVAGFIEDLIDNGPLWYRGTLPQEGMVRAVIRKWTRKLNQPKVETVSLDATNNIAERMTSEMEIVGHVPGWQVRSVLHQFGVPVEHHPNDMEANSEDRP